MLLNFISILIFALAGIVMLIYEFLKKKQEGNSYIRNNRKNNDPVVHIRDNLFFEVPVERILLLYFAVVFLTYLIELVLGYRLPEVDLGILYLSGTAFFLCVYKIVMGIGVVRRFSPTIFFSLLFSVLIFVAVYSAMPDNLIPFLKSTRPFHLTIHFLGLAMGLGGTFVVDIMFSHFIKDHRISVGESLIMHLISQMILFGLFLLIVSGAPLLAVDFEGFMQRPRFVMKMIVVFVVLINGGALNLYVTPKMKRISLKGKGNGGFEWLTKVSFALGGISIVSWLSAFLLAMQKDLFNLPLSYLLSGYITLLVIAIAGSQVAKTYLTKKL